MEIRKLHAWDVTLKEAAVIQKSLRDQVLLTPLDLRRVRTVAGADVSFNRFSDRIYAGFVVLDLKTLEPIEKVGAVMNVSFPYQPGLLSFREIPPLLKAARKLKSEPDAFVFDGQGIAHPRRIGIATHMGLILDRPTMGCAKSLLVGTYEDLDTDPGSTSPLVHKGELVGYAVRTKKNVQPVFISPGHRMDFESSNELALRCSGGYRIPEPTRLAHNYVNELRREGDPV